MSEEIPFRDAVRVWESLRQPVREPSVLATLRGIYESSQRPTCTSRDESLAQPGANPHGGPMGGLPPGHP